MERWFDRMLRDGMACTLAGDYQPFPVVAEAALHVIGEGRLTEDQVRHVLDRIGELPAQLDAEPAMRLHCPVIGECRILGEAVFARPLGVSACDEDRNRILIRADLGGINSALDGRRRGVCRR